jgi:hypothetical protein
MQDHKVGAAARAHGSKRTVAGAELFELHP